MGCQLRITHGVLNILVSHPGLDRPGVVAGVRQGIAEAVAAERSYPSSDEELLRPLSSVLRPIVVPGCPKRR
jgi:hypothetical protein